MFMAQKGFYRQLVNASGVSNQCSPAGVYQRQTNSQNTDLFVIHDDLRQGGDCVWPP
jgi:hypothetical protein